MIRDKMIKSGSPEDRLARLFTLLRDERLTDMERCWVYWNISDQLAIMRRADEELQNHKLFFKQLSSMEEKYLPWIVSDATQCMTLLAGGYETFWNAVYDVSCRQTPKTPENVFVRFESHRATVKVPMKVIFAFEREHSLRALENLKETAREISALYGAEDTCFYQLTYLTQAIGAYYLLNRNYMPFLEEAQEYFDKIIGYLDVNQPEQAENPDRLPGSWEQLNRIRSKYSQASSGIHNYILQLINVGEYHRALSSYRRILPYHLPLNRYFLTRIAEAEENTPEVHL